MRKIYTFLVLSVTAVTLNAQVMTEYFQDATPGQDLEGYNGWYVSLKEAEAQGVSPVIEGETLFYDDYPGTDTGYVAILDSLIGMDNVNKRVSTKVVEFGGGDTLRPVIGEKFYAAFICSIGASSKNSWRDFVTWEGSTGSSWQRGRVFVEVQNSGQDLQFAVTKNSSSEGDMVATEVFTGGVGLYHLLVLVYEAVEGESNDVVHLYVNPDPNTPESEQTPPLSSVDVQSDYSEGTEIKFNLRQRGIGALVGGIRVGRTWEEVVQGIVEEPTGIKNEGREISHIRSYRNTIITDGPGSVELYDISGRRVMKQITNGRLETSLSSGLYIVSFEDRMGTVTTGKVILRDQ